MATSWPGSVASRPRPQREAAWPLEEEPRPRPQREAARLAAIRGLSGSLRALQRVVVSLPGLRRLRGSLEGPRRLWFVAAGLLVVAALGGAALGVSLTSGGGHGSEGGRLVSFRDPATGIYGARPPAWSVASRAGGVVLTSPDRTAVVEVAAPAPAAQASGVLASSVAAIQRSYSDARVIRVLDRVLDNLKARAAVMSASNKAGVALRVLVVVARGHKEAYLLEVFLSDAARARTVLGAQEIVSSLRLTD